jgi:hypothetical protein
MLVMMFRIVAGPMVFALLPSLMPDKHGQLMGAVLNFFGGNYLDIDL